MLRRRLPSGFVDLLWPAETTLAAGSLTEWTQRKEEEAMLLFKRTLARCHSGQRMGSMCFHVPLLATTLAKCGTSLACLRPGTLPFTLLKTGAAVDHFKTNPCLSNAQEQQLPTRKLVRFIHWQGRARAPRPRPGAKPHARRFERSQLCRLNCNSRPTILICRGPLRVLTSATVCPRPR